MSVFPTEPLPEFAKRRKWPAPVLGGVFSASDGQPVGIIESITNLGDPASSTWEVTVRTQTVPPDYRESIEEVTQDVAASIGLLATGRIFYKAQTFLDRPIGGSADSLKEEDEDPFADELPPLRSWRATLEMPDANAPLIITRKVPGFPNVKWTEMTSLVTDNDSRFGGATVNAVWMDEVPSFRSAVNDPNDPRFALAAQIRDFSAQVLSDSKALTQETLEQLLVKELLVGRMTSSSAIIWDVDSNAEAILAAERVGLPVEIFKLNERYVWAGGIQGEFTTFTPEGDPSRFRVAGGKVYYLKSVATRPSTQVLPEGVRLIWDDQGNAVVSATEPPRSIPAGTVLMWDEWGTAVPYTPSLSDSPDIPRFILDQPAISEEFAEYKWDKEATPTSKNVSLVFPDFNRAYSIWPRAPC